ncbi:MAG TPA: hypothetical protein DD412_07845 [Holosporales bacterium]|nr:hypothetical protein [Holosporales bacterium]
MNKYIITVSLVSILTLSEGVASKACKAFILQANSTLSSLALKESERMSKIANGDIRKVHGTEEFKRKIVAAKRENLTLIKKRTEDIRLAVEAAQNKPRNGGGIKGFLKGNKEKCEAVQAS